MSIFVYTYICKSSKKLCQHVIKWKKISFYIFFEKKIVNVRYCGCYFIFMILFLMTFTQLPKGFVRHNKAKIWFWRTRTNKNNSIIQNAESKMFNSFIFSCVQKENDFHFSYNLQFNFISLNFVFFFLML